VGSRNWQTETWERDGGPWHPEVEFTDVCPIPGTADFYLTTNGIADNGRPARVGLAGLVPRRPGQVRSSADRHRSSAWRPTRSGLVDRLGPGRPECHLCRQDRRRLALTAGPYGDPWAQSGEDEDANPDRMDRSTTPATAYLSQIPHHRHARGAARRQPRRPGPPAVISSRSQAGPPRSRRNAPPRSRAARSSTTQRVEPAQQGRPLSPGRRPPRRPRGAHPGRPGGQGRAAPAPRVTLKYDPGDTESASWPRRTRISMGIRFVSEG
jgi:hypothetical protein